MFLAFNIRPLPAYRCCSRYLTTALYKKWNGCVHMSLATYMGNVPLDVYVLAEP